MRGRRQRTLRTTVAIWVFVAAQLPATVVLVTTAIVLESRTPLENLAMLGVPMLTLMATSAGFAWILANHVAEPLVRLRAIAVLATHPDAEGPNLRSAALREPYLETAAVLTALDRLRRRAADDVSRRDQLAAYVAHDLRTPIAAVALDLRALAPGLDRARASRELAWVLQEVDQLVAALRSAPRSDAPRDEAATAVVPLVEAVLHDTRPAPSLAVGMKVLAGFSTAMPPSAVRSIVQNLVVNAQRHAGAWVRVEVSRGYVRVSNDLGEAAAGRAVNGDGATLRHGLGLEIVRHVLAQYGGHLRLEEREDAYEAIAYMPLADREVPA